MDLTSIRFLEGPDRHETLALSLMSVATSLRMEIDYHDLCAALGLSCTTVSTRLDPSPGWWMTYGRDAFVESAARLFGLELRNLQPPDVAVDMLAADEFGQHWEYSYKPLIRRALENGQPVLAWQGWPEFRWPLWGVITSTQESDFAGWTLWSQDQPQPLCSPALQCYVVERAETDRGSPPRDRLLSVALAHMDAYMNAAPLAPPLEEREPPRIVTGPAAYRAWIQWIESGSTDLSREAWNEHRQHADFVAAGHESGAVFLRRMLDVTAQDLRERLGEAIEHCGRVSRLLASSRDPGLVASLFGTPQGRQELLDAVRSAGAENRLLADTIHELALAAQI